MTAHSSAPSPPPSRVTSPHPVILHKHCNAFLARAHSVVVRSAVSQSRFLLSQSPNPSCRNNPPACGFRRHLRCTVQQHSVVLHSVNVPRFSCFSTFGSAVDSLSCFLFFYSLSLCGRSRVPSRSSSFALCRRMTDVAVSSARHRGIARIVRRRTSLHA